MELIMDNHTNGNTNGEDPSLQQYESSLHKFKDERDAIQKKTFTKWVNKHLKKAHKEIHDLFQDLRDGLNLISLLEVLSNEVLPREKGSMRFHMLQNVQISLDFLRFRKIKLVNIRAEDIVDGNPKLTLGLIWTIILHFQISDIITHQTDEKITAKEALLRWAQRTTDRYPGVRVGDFTKSWRDGLAFNAIIHRNRPDLLDYRSCMKRTARDNLDSAFTIAERELNVTKLLDPEDVDTPEPDEKSLITYISSLYDVFPRPAAHNPFIADDDKARKLEEYCNLSSSLYLWMREALADLQDRTFPNTLVEMKSLLADCTRFRVEEVPPRQHEKQRVAHLYKELQKTFRNITSMDISEDLRIESMERLWNKVMAAHQERDQAIHDEIARLEKLQRLAEKVHRETKQCDGKMDDIERHIAEEEKRVQRLHPNDAKHNCDQIEIELKHVEDSLKSMSRDVQTLRDGRYHQALELQKRVQQLHERFLNMRMNFQTRVLNVLIARSLKVEEKKVTKPRPLSLEKLIETNKSFKFLQECLDWVNNKLKYLEEADYGTDLPSVQTLLEQHHTEHRLIDQFQRNVEQCSSSKTQFRGEELELYCKLLSKLEKRFSELLVLSNKRMSDLDTLLDFIQSATNELIWMNEKEEVEVSRDWSSKTLNIPDIERYQKTLTTDLEKREVQFSAVQDRGESLVLQKHPASKCIEAYLAAMQTQWSWLLQLMSCLDIHLKYAFAYHQFFEDSKECQQWLKQIENRLSTTYSRQNFSIDEGERLMKEMQDLRDELSHYSNIVSSLIERSLEIAPLKQRRQPLPRPLRVTALCQYKQQSMSVLKDEQCWLHDNTNKNKWKIINAHGVEGMVPGVCFVIPPPNPEALELAESLKKQFEAIVTLWTSKQRKLRQNMIFATIKIIKSWDITKFRSIDPVQRESIIKALNEDTQKLLNEGSSDDPALKRLQEEIAYCNKLFADLQRMLDQDEIDKVNKSQARRFNDLVASIQSTLTEKERILKQKTQSPIPRSKDLVHRLMQEQKDFESDLHLLEPRVSEVRDAFRELASKTPALQSRHDAVMESWNNLWSMSSLYIERLKAVELTLSHYDEAVHVVSNAEMKLVSYDSMPSDVESAAKVEENLRTLKREMIHQQIVIDQCSQSVSNVRHLVELSRPHQAVHTDVTKLEEDVKKVRRRWDQAGTQVEDRLHALESSISLLQSYKGKYNEQKVFVSQMCAKSESLKSVSRVDSREMHREIESSMTMYSTISHRKAAIEDTNIDGERYIREAKIYDLHLKQFLEGLEDNTAALEASEVMRSKLLTGAETVSQELHILNQEYTDLLNVLLQRVNELKSLVSSQEGQKFSVTITQAAPITRTAPTNLTREQVPLSSTSSTSDPFNHPQHRDSNTHHTNIDNTFNRRSCSDASSSKSSKVIDINMDIESSREIEDNPILNFSGTTLSFTEVKSSLKSSTIDIESLTITETKTVYDVTRRENISFSDAVFRNIINIRRMKYIDIETRKEYDLEEAVSRNYLDRNFLSSITQYYGISDPKYKVEITILEAIQRELYNPRSGNFMNPNTGTDISLEEAVLLGIIKKDKVLYLIEKKIVRCNRYTIIEAVLKGYLDPNSGLFTSPHTGSVLSLTEAYQLGYMYTSPAIVEDTVSITEALDKNLINDHLGTVCDPDSGKWYTIDSAINHGILSKKLTEIVDLSVGNIVTIPSALQNGLINPLTGRFVNPLNGHELSIKEAHRRKLILPSLTLKQAFEEGSIDENGDILNPINSLKISLIRSVVIGVIGLDVKCIVCPETDRLFTLAEALVRGIVTPDCKFWDKNSGEVLSIAQAANRGYLASVSRRMIFDIEGFKDIEANDFISFNEAVSKGMIDLDTGNIQEMGTGKVMSLQEGIDAKLVMPQVYEMLSREIGIIRDNTELNVLECVMKDILDPKTGMLIDPTTKRPLRLLDAVESGLITEEGAITLKSLLNITVTLTSVTKTTTRYVTVEKRSFGSDLKITFEQAFQQGLIDERNGTFTEPVTGNVMSIEEAVIKGHLNLVSSVNHSEAFTEQSEVSVFQNDVKFRNSVSATISDNDQSSCVREHRIVHNHSQSSFLEKSEMMSSEIVKSHDFEESVNQRGVSSSEETLNSQNENDAITRPKGLFARDSESRDLCYTNGDSLKDKREIARDDSDAINFPFGWSLKKCIDVQIFDPITGFFKFPNSEERLSFKESIDRKLLNPNSARVMDCNLDKSYPLDIAIKNNLLTHTGKYISSTEIPMKEALERNLILHVEDINHYEKIDDNKSIIFSKISSYSRDLEENKAFVDSVNVKSDFEEARSPIILLVREATGNFITFEEAEKLGVIDSTTREYVDEVSGRRLSIKEAVIQGLVVPSEHLEFSSDIDLDYMEELQNNELNVVESCDGLSGTSLNVTSVDARSDAEIVHSCANKDQDVDVINADSEVHGYPSEDIDLKSKQDKSKSNDESPQNVEEMDVDIIDDCVPKKVPSNACYSVPRFEVTIGKAQTINSPAKAVVLKKVRRKKMPASDAAKKGIVDVKTAETLNNVESLKGPDGKPVSLEQAVQLSLIDGNEGNIKNPKNSGMLTINEAMNDGILDPESGQFVLPVGRSLSIPEAVNQGLVEPNQQKIVHPEHGDHLSIQEAIVCEIIDPLSEMTEPSSGKNLTLETAIDMGVIDSDSGYVQMWDGKISMLNAVEMEIFAPLPSIRIDLPPLAVTFPVALRQGFVDVEKREYIHPITKKTTPLLEAIDQGLIMTIEGGESDSAIHLWTALNDDLIDPVLCVMSHPAIEDLISIEEAVESGLLLITSEIPDLSEESGDALTLKEAIEKGIFDLETACLRLPGVKRSIPLCEAISSGYICPQSVLVYNSQTDKLVPFSKACDCFLIDNDKQLYIHPVTKQELPIVVAFKRGFIVPARKPMSLEAAINQGLFLASNGTFKDSVTNVEVNIELAVRRGIIDAFLSQIKDTKADEFVSLETALKNRIVIAKSGKMRNTKNNSLISLEEALRLGFIRTLSLKMPLIKAVKEGYYNLKTGLFFNPLSGTEITLKEALKSSLINPDSVSVKNSSSKQYINLQDAVSSGIINAVEGTLILPHQMNLLEAIETGSIVNLQIPLTLSEALEYNLYNPTSGLFQKFDSDDDKTLRDMIEEGFIDCRTVSVLNATKSETLSLQDSIECRLVDPKEGTYLDEISRAEINLYDAYDRGLILPVKRKLSFIEAVTKGYYDPESHSFLDVSSLSRMSLKEASAKKIIKTTSTVYVDRSGNKTYAFCEAIGKILIDLDSGSVFVESTNETLDFKEAIEDGLLIEVEHMSSLKYAVMNGIYNENDGLFLDPLISERLSLQDAIATTLIDPTSVIVKQTTVEGAVEVSLEEAIACKVIDGKRSLYITEDNKTLPLNTAFEQGYIFESHPSISLQRALRDNFYDENSRTFSLPFSQKNLTLRECLKRNIINGDLPCYWDKTSNKLLTLNETIKKQIISSSLALFYPPPKMDSGLTLKSALESGYLLDTENPFSLYDAIKFGLYDVKSRKFINPKNGFLVTLQSACKDSIISPSISIIKNPKGDYLNLSEALKIELINDVDGTYVVSMPNEVLTLQEAYDKKLIVPFSIPCNLELAFQMHLFNPETGQFVNPLSNQTYNLLEGLETGFLEGNNVIVHNPNSQCFKSLGLAIEDGTINLNNGTISDPRNINSNLSLDEAFRMSFLKVTEHLRDILGKELIDQNDEFKFECTMKEAIENEIISTDVALIKDSKTSKFLTIQQAIEAKDINLRKKVVFCRISKRINKFIVTYDEKTVYLEKPLSLIQAVENSHLNVLSGMFTEPQSKQMHTLKDAVALGYIDCDSAVLKDTKEKKFLRIPESFEKNTLDPDKGTVVNTASNQILTLKGALDTGLLIPYPCRFSLIDALEYKMYDYKTGLIINPFNNTSMTLEDAILVDLINPNSALIKDPDSETFLDLPSAIEKGVLNPRSGCLVNLKSGHTTNLLDAFLDGLLVSSKQRMAIEEKYRLYTDNTAKLLSWLQEREIELAELGLVREDSEDLYRQISNAKAIREDLEDHQRAVASCIDQAQQLIEQGEDVLSKDELQTLQKNSDTLKKRFNRASEESEKLLRRLTTALEELRKFSNEYINFVDWLKEAHVKQTDKERCLLNLDHLKENADAYKAFSSDAIAHQADLRFITMAAQKFVDESKDYLKVLNEFRTNLPRRLGHLEPADSEVKLKVQEVSTAFQNLLNRIDRLSDKFATLANKQQNFADAMDKAANWLNSIQKSAKKLIEEPTAADPRAIQDQLDRAKTLNMELIQQGRLIESAKLAASVLLDSLEDSEISVTERRAIENKVKRLEEDYTNLCNLVNGKCNDLQMALLHSQDIQDGLDRLLKWLEDAESNMRNQSRPVSLIKEKLEEQIQAHKMMLSDIDGQKPTLDAVNDSARDLLNSSNPRLAKKIETKLKEANLRFDKLCEKAQKRSELFEEMCKSLGIFHTLSTRFEEWLSTMFEIVRSKDSRTEARELSVIEDVANQKDSRRAEFEEILACGKNLVTKRDVTDTSYIKDKLKTFEQQWKELGELLADQHRKNKERVENLSAYETLRGKVLEWIGAMEMKVEGLEQVALDKEVLRRQSLEIKALAKEHADYAPTIDKVNDLGHMYESNLKDGSRHYSGSPTRKTSPTRMSPPKLRRSPDYGSPTGRGIQSPLSSISSGFSSARSSADNLGGIEDLSPVQQQLAEINHRYSLLGVKLSDRGQEINSFSDEIKVYLESLKNLLNFVQTKERQMPKDALPVSKDQAAKQLQILKGIQEEMQERQMEMDRLKSQTLDLARRKPSTPGIDSVQMQMADLNQRWNELQSVLKDRMKFIQDLKDFQDSQDAMNNWLGQKEKMFQVLGPIASDPRMVTSQIQQVQVLRDEFSSQEPILKKSRDSGHSLLDHLDINSPAAKKIREQIHNTNMRWDDLMNKLTDRERNLDAASGATKDFQDSLNRLQDRLQHIGDEFDHLSEAGSDAESQLRKLNDLEDQLEDQRPLLADAETVCEQLCEILSDSASKTEIKNKLNGVEKQYNNLNRKMSNRKAELESALKEDKDFYVSFDRIQHWLNDMEDTLAHEFPVSANQDILKRQVQEFGTIYKEVLSKDHEVHLLMSKGSDMLQKITRKAESTQLQNKMDNMKRQWEKVRKAANDRHTHLQRCSENCKKFQTTLNSFLPWLNKLEDKVHSLQSISFHRVQLDKQVKEIQAIKNDLSKHSQEYENTCNYGEVLISSCDIDTAIIRDDIDSIRKRWDRMNHDVMDRSQALEDISHRLNLYQDKARDVNHSLHRLEDRLMSHDALGDSSRDPKLLARMKDLLTEAGDVKRQLNGLREYVSALISEASPSVDTSHITDEVEELEKRHKQLTQKLEDRCCDLESASEIVAHFNNKMKDAHLDLNHLEEELDNMAPIARDVNTVNSQINQIKNYLGRLKRSRDDCEEVEHQCQDIITHGYTPDPKGCRNQLDGLHRQLIRLEERAKSRDGSLEAMLNRLEKFYEDYHDISQDLNDTIEEERSFKPVGGEVDAIRSQQEEFKYYHRDRLEPLGKKIENLNKVGQGLIQSASSGVNTNVLEQDLDALNDRWNNIKQRMNERERRLDNAFLQSGKFLEAIAGVQKWLEDTEEMVANQKPPSADYKVVKAQLQEQKFLNKLLLDRQTSMSSLMEMGTEIMKNADPVERMQIEAQLGDLIHRFEELSNAARERTDALERTIPVAKDFQDRIIPLDEWLEQTEKKLAAMATIPTDQDKIRQRMIEHEALHDDIMDHKEAFEDLTEVAQTLMGLVGDDEAQMVVDKLQEATNHFAKVVEDSQHIGQLLADAFRGMGSFNVNYEDLMAWINEMASRLSRFHTLSVYVEKLQEQLDELVELSEEIADHQKQVDHVANAGQEIMKHASGDDVIRMKEKLDNLSVKFTDLTSRAADRLRQAQDALPLVQNFHACHERITSWMDATERQLKSLENVGLASQETTIQRLEGELQEYRPLVDTLNHLGPQLCQMSPGQGAADIENKTTRVNRRFDAICEQVQRKAERIELSKQRNVEVIGDIEDLLDWFHEAEKQLLQAEPLSADPDNLAALLKDQKLLNNEVSSQKGRVRDILSSAKKLMRESSGDDLAEVKDKAEELKDITNSVSNLCADRLAALEQALPLAEHFFETHADLCQWLDDIEAEAELLETPALNASQIKKQQDRNKALMQSVHEHKALVDKLNKTGAALKKLCTPSEGAKVQDIIDSDNSRYHALKDILRDRQNALEEAMQATSQFSDKLDGMLNSLSNTADQLQNAEPVSAHTEKIEEQLGENQAVMKDLDKRSNALEAVKRAADDVIVKAGGARDPAVKDIKQKLDKLNALWDNIQKLAKNRGRSLEDALAAAERFWDELTMVMKTLKELQDSLNAQEPPAVDPGAIQHQQNVLQEIKQEIEQTKPEVDQCRQAGQDLMQLCGEPDKPEVKKHIEDLDSAWDNVTSLYAKREQNLVDAMEKAMNFHDILGNLLEFLDYAEGAFSGLGPVGSDIEAVKGQIHQLQGFKNEVDPHMVEIESLNRQAHELMERTSPAQAKSLRQPLAQINKRWDDLLKGIVERQRELENALLRLGQFQHALDEFMVWMSKTEKTLDDLTPVFGDPQIIEVELAKHKVLMNDIHAHQTSVDTLNSAGRQLIEANRGSEDASVTQSKLNKLNKRWQHLQDKAAQRQRELEEALNEAQIFNQEIQDLLMWLSDIDSQLVSSKPVGGLPETAREQLNRFMELYNDLDNNKHKIDSVLQQGQSYLKRSNEGAAGNLQHNLKTLKQRWENVLNRANDRKIKLEIALREATEFHQALQDFVEWLTNAEKFLSNLKPVSRVMDVVLEQIEDHKAFQKEVGSHREVMLNLDKKGTHLKYFSQKQDVILIKNLLISVQHRWERVVSKAAERTRALDHGYKESKEFHDAWSDLSHWLDDAEKQLDVLTHVGNDPEKIKQMLAKHKEFQRALGAKQPMFDGTMKLGRSLKDKCPKSDVGILQGMMDDLKNKWNNVCAKSVDKQRKLEEALLFSGQFKDAVQALIDWLEKSKRALSENQLLHGDLDTVMTLVDQHKTFQDELKNRAGNLESVRRTARDLLETANDDDADHIRQQLTKLDRMWVDVANLAEDKQRRLEEALKEAERLHKAVHMLLEWLSDAEMKLRFAGPLPDDEETTKQQIDDHQRFMREMVEQEVNKDRTIAHAQEILKKCHPDGVSVIRHWITIIQSRWEEISLWAKQREQRLNDHLRSLRDILDLLEELLGWLIRAETSLTALEAQPLPDEIPILEQLITDHQEFMDDMTKKQPDVERVTKAFQSKRQPQQQGPPGKEKGRERHESAQDRKSGRGTPSLTKAPLRQAFEPDIKNPRARELVDRWRNVWLLAMERQRRLQDKLNYLKELERIKNFDFDDWRRKFLAWMNNKKSRVMDLFRKIDKDNDGRVTYEEFIEGILKSKFPTSRLEMERVAEIFDRNKDGFIDHKEYIDTLRPDREKGPITEAEKIQDEVQRQVAQCTCVQRFKVYQVGEGKYRFGESQKLRLVRILRSTVMVRVGGGWVALDEFLVKNDPCRAKGRTNLELREQFILADGVSQSLQAFKSKASPNSSMSSQSGGSSFNRSGMTLPATGPITKVREKSERSVPMSLSRQRPGQDSGGSDFSTSFSEGDSSFGSRNARSRPTPSRLTAGTPNNRPSSRPTSRPSSRPPSRAASDLSSDNLDGYRARKMGSTGAQQRTPSASSGRSGTKIPTVRRTPSFNNSTPKPDPIKRERERWK